MVKSSNGKRMSSGYKRPALVKSYKENVITRISSNPSMRICTKGRNGTSRT